MILSLIVRFFRIKTAITAPMFPKKPFGNSKLSENVIPQNRLVDFDWKVAIKARA